jgi:hypothetical protein
MNVSTTGGMYNQNDYSSDAKKLRQELAEKDVKIKDINGIVA